MNFYIVTMSKSNFPKVLVNILIYGGLCVIAFAASGMIPGNRRPPRIDADDARFFIYIGFLIIVIGYLARHLFIKFGKMEDDEEEMM